jgi:hypothetical protein
VNNNNIKRQNKDIIKTIVLYHKKNISLPPAENWHYSSKAASVSILYHTNKKIIQFATQFPSITNKLEDAAMRVFVIPAA